MTCFVASRCVVCCLWLPTALLLLPDYLSSSIRNHLNWFFLSLTFFKLSNRLESIEPRFSTVRFGSFRFVSFNWWISDWLLQLVVDKYRNQSMVAHTKTPREKEGETNKDRDGYVCRRISCAFLICILEGFLFFFRRWPKLVLQLDFHTYVGGHWTLNRPRQKTNVK